MRGNYLLHIISTIIVSEKSKDEKNNKIKRDDNINLFSMIFFLIRLIDITITQCYNTPLPDSRYYRDPDKSGKSGFPLLLEGNFLESPLACPSSGGRGVDSDEIGGRGVLLLFIASRPSS